ncbi:TIGR01440 family protein [Paenibacillus pasadenensis]|uniref:TIGR01440 family protein n=1 Tax=Paenibacillus pasadenensis TaxID=217090 RepID=UPI00203E9EA5|nr:TIGR01440 family protein [Paenibacillus pasadenensis]MCM3747609.1 TIGR01440 family protein [Paenibacillus pasadenensis]
MGSEAMSPESISAGVESLILELAAGGRLLPGQLLVFGVSTSEVLGQRIGTSGSEGAAAAIFAGMQRARADIGFVPVFQCCEHLNRALVLERAAADRYGLEPVHAVPVPGAGGSMASHAFRHLEEAILVESVQANAGIDIGETLIGMHLKRVAVPVRPTLRTIGEARVTMAFTRPKLIGGPRAVYELPGAQAADGGSCD